MGAPEKWQLFLRPGALGTLNDLGVLWGRQGLGEMSVKTGWSWGEMGTPKSETRCSQGEEGRGREVGDIPQRKPADLVGERGPQIPGAGAPGL